MSTAGLLLQGMALNLRAVHKRILMHKEWQKNAFLEILLFPPAIVILKKAQLFIHLSVIHSK